MDDTQIPDTIRDKIIANPEILLENTDVMRALAVASGDQADNVIDLRSVALNRLEARFDRLNDKHQTVIAAAYDNVAGTNQIHRAILRMMDPTTFSEFLTVLNGDVANILRVASIRFVLESGNTPQNDTLNKSMIMKPTNFIDDYIGLDRAPPHRQVTLRKVPQNQANIYGDHTADIQSEVCMKIGLGKNETPAMLLLGSKDPLFFTPQDGTDLLTFFAGVFERLVRRWFV